MEFLPRSMGTRPRLACEVRAEGVVAARAEDATAMLSAVSRVPFADPIGVPQIHVTEDGNGSRAPFGRVPLVEAVRRALDGVSQRTRDVTLVVPDSATRVLLLDFDTLPPKAADALPVVRFRLKKLLPFDADHAAVSYQVMATNRDGLQVLAVAMPAELLAEYEGIVREAGFEPGAVIPSTLAALAGLEDSERPMLIVNAGQEGVTTAIVKAGVLLLHRSMDLGDRSIVPDDYATARPAVDERGISVSERPVDTSISAIAARLAGTQGPSDQPVRAAATTDEVAQAVSVAAAYFEDTLQTPPAVVLSAGTLGADALTRLLDVAEVGPVAVQEMMDRQKLGPGAVSAGGPGGIPLGWLVGVRGALAN